MDDCRATKGRMEYVLVSAQLVKTDRFKYPEHRFVCQKWHPAHCIRCHFIDSPQ
ncbi:hypothetical protein KIN20_011610 [Parelaphostrongylus tenuis]|uniref:Uncharacterized protein n=1 Tax=Parelaphostrongylus tenuis TaxID=148309 RepID=A0AAD5MSB1_PARTN|nr:hypothetical protein KIN20_011610 [Parelaphostrongylus tenuis]